VQKKGLNPSVVCAGGGAIAGFVALHSPVGAMIGAGFGFMIPKVVANFQKERHKSLLIRQLPDAIQMLTSCLKAGLSLNQAFTVMVEEMSGPAVEEFGYVVKSLRVGVSLEEAFLAMHKRVNAEELGFIFSAILIARETGGDLPTVLTKLVDTLRDRRKLKESIDTFTIQGRAQAFIMSMIPIFFVGMTLQQDAHHFDIMLQCTPGRIALGVAVVLEIVGTIAIIEVSKIKI
jgi:tight adherence protein B